MSLRSARRPWHLLEPALVAALLALAPGLPGTGALYANPAQQNVVEDYRQPDGTTLRLALWGDEFAHGFDTPEGYAVVRNMGTSWWEYATRDAGGALVPSGRRVGREMPPEAPRLRPSKAAIESSRQRFGVPSREAPRLAARPAWASGTINILVIMVQFPADSADPNGPQPAVNASFTSAQVHDNLFGATPTGPGNMTDFFDENSYGALHLVGTVVGPFTVAHDKNDYDDGPLSAPDLVREAVWQADARVDFAPFDNDGDGQVDMVAICYAGNGPDNRRYHGADPNTDHLWPHAWSIDAVSVDGGARSVSQYFMAPELYDSTPRVRTIGIYCHEFAHKLGLPDLYDTDDSSIGVGNWDLAGSGNWNSDSSRTNNGDCPAHLGAWCKSWLGWMTPTNLTGINAEQTIPQAETNAFAVELLNNPGGPNDSPGGSGEYFLIENRQRTGFDRGLPGCGLLVWHVDEARSDNTAEGHSSGSHRLVDLEEAGGSPQNLDLSEGKGTTPADSNSNRGDADDPYPGSSDNRLWSDDTNPSARLYPGWNSGLRMELVGSPACGSSMIVRISDAGLPHAFTASVRPNPARGTVTLRYGLPRGGPVQLIVYDIAGREVARPMDETVPEGFHDALWDPRLAGLKPQVYHYRLVSQDVVMKGRFIVLP